MIDIHTHVLPGVDDGAKDLEASLALLQMAAAAGTTAVFATPHVGFGAERLEWSLIKEKTEEINNTAESKGIHVHVYEGAELEMDWDLLNIFDSKHYEYCLAGSRYILIELPPNNLPRYADEFLFELQLRDLVPIIAHPERNRALRQYPHILHQWVRNGVLAQSNIGSFIGNFGNLANEYVRIFLKNNLIHFLGSDAHNVEHRSTDIREALAELTQIALPEVVQTITYGNPEAILENRPININIDQELLINNESKKGLLARLWGK